MFTQQPQRNTYVLKYTLQHYLHCGKSGPIFPISYFYLNIHKKEKG